MRLEFKKSLYSSEMLMRTAYVFTDQAYIYLDENEENFFVDLEAKPNNNISEIQGEFKNELLAQTLRKSIAERTGNIRELILQRALSSSLVLDRPIWLQANDSQEQDYDLDDILNDWFERG